MKAQTMEAKPTSRAGGPALQVQIDKNWQTLSDSGRKVALAYVGMWAMVLDGVQSLLQRSVKLLNDAEQRGASMEDALNQRLGHMEKSATRGIEELQHRLDENVQQVGKGVTGAREELEEELEKRVEQALINLGIPTRERLERLNQEIDRLNAKIDKELSRRQKVENEEAES